MVSLASLAGNITDRAQLADIYSVSPVVVTVQSPNGNSSSLCVAAAKSKKTQNLVAVVDGLSPGRSCSDRPTTFQIESKETIKERVYQTSASKFIGDPYEQGQIEQNLWLFQSVPVAVYFKTVDEKSGASQWDAFCVAPIYPDPRYKMVGAAPNGKILIYKRTADPHSISDPETEIKCGPMSFALSNTIKTEKPRFIGSPAEIQKLTAHSSHAPQPATASRAHAVRP